MAIKLTARQQQILDLIRQQIGRTGFPPTRAEIARELGFRSANAAEDHLKALARKGAIALTAGASRGIRLLTPAPGQPGVANVALNAANTQQPHAGGAPYPHTANAPHVQAAGVQPPLTQSHNGSTSPSSAFTSAQHLGRLLLPVIGRVAAGSPILATPHIEREIAVEPALFTQEPDYLLKVRGLSMRDAGILDGDLLAVKKATEARNGQIVVARLGDDVTVKRLERQGRHIRLLPENPDFAPIEIQAHDEFALEGIAVGLIRTMQ
ncbi:transcriptional repressor LexA [Pusillimonas minor]|uniref:LexA repressor n=1 Tax=Pusillimonas minor TaxID=2697024 RepID=A0A842HRF3_9BURK|nr:transcriptional repressor LexA [Pusillimonas minor]MBC2770208.1 transcriptional repressor LexA [Pusillimonas minor]